MTERITQELGFDVAGALANLDKLNGSLTAFNRRLGSLGKRINSFNSQSTQMASTIQGVGTAANTHLQSTATHANNVARSFNRVGTSAKRDLGAAIQHTERLTVSWGLVTRVIATQLIVRTFRRTTAALAQGTRAAIDFRTQIAEIQTIANRTLGTNDAVAQSVRQISDAYNIPLDDTARALYQTISNQIGEGAENLRFLESSARFAKGGVTSLENSVNLLAGTINAFNGRSSEADQIAAQFFKTIELGRTTAGELANSFGRVLPFARNLGVELAELQGLTAGLTVRGVGTAETMTQLRGVMNAFLKPSEAMKRSLRELGFENGEVAVATLGLAGAIKEIADTGADLSAVFQNIRGAAAALTIANATDEFEALTQQVREAEAALNELKAGQILEDQSQQVAKAANQIRNSLTTNFGQSILETLASILKLTGGVESGIKVLEALGSTAVAAAAGFGLYIVQGRLAATTTQAVTKTTQASGAALGVTTAQMETQTQVMQRQWLPTMGRVAAQAAGFAALALAAASLGKAIGAAIAERRMRPFLNAIETIGRQGKKRIAELEVEFRKLDLRLSKLTKSLLQAGRAANKLFLEEMDDAKFANQQFEASIQATTSGIINAFSNLAAAARRQLGQVNSVIDSSRDRVTSLNQQQSDLNFEFFNLGQAENDAERFRRLLSRSADEAVKSRRLIQDTSDPNNIQRGRQQFQRSLQFAKRAQQLAQQAGSRDGERQAVSRINALLTQQKRLEEDIQRSQQQRAQQLEKVAQAREADTQKLRESTKLLLQNLKTTDAQGNLLSDQERQLQARRRDRALQQISDVALSQDDFDLASSLGLAQVAAQFQQQLQRDPVQLALDAQRGAEQALAQTQSVFERGQINLSFATGGANEAIAKFLSEATGTEVKPAANTKQFQSQLKAAKDITQEFQKQVKDSSDLETSISQRTIALQEQQKILQGQQLVTRGLFGETRLTREANRQGTGRNVRGKDAIEDAQRIDALRNSFVSFLQSGVTPTSDEMAVLRSRLAELTGSDAVKTFPKALGALTKSFQLLDAQSRDTTKLDGIQKVNEQYEQWKQTLDEIEQGLQRVEQKQAPANLGNTPQNRLPQNQQAPGQTVSSIGPFTFNVTETADAGVTAREVVTLIQREFRRTGGALV